ncbi:MAG: hypothetical protein GY938_01190 [Ketobacter sp.]|nr:hypothetical protein [Ketobacter sp.]
MESFWKTRFNWMTEDQWECFEFLCWIYHGAHHVQTKRIKPCGNKGIEINTSYGGFATFDFDDLTRAVVYAHDKCIRFAIESSGPGMLRLLIHKRHAREGSMSERHPQLEEHVSVIRKTIPDQQPPEVE